MKRVRLVGHLVVGLVALCLGATVFAQSSQTSPTADTPPAGLTADAWQAIRAAVERDRYAAQTNPEGAFAAVNPAQEYRTRFTAEGITVQPRGTDFALGLRLERWGYGEALEAVSPAEPAADGQRVIYVRGGLEEWYVNRPTGLEQGFTLAAAPRRAADAAGLLRLEMSVLGATGEAVGDTIRFTDGDGETRLSYGGLVAWDATGRELPVGMSLVENRLILEVDDHAAVYPLTVDPVILNEAAKLTASDGAAGDFFGWSVAVSGDTVVVGARLDDDNGPNSGSAYVFVEPGGGWAGSLTQTAKLTASDGAAVDIFGESVAVSGDTVVVGAPRDDDNGSASGSAYVFVKPGGGWAGSLTQTAKLTASDGADGDQFGESVAVSGDTVVVGAQLNDDNGTSSGSAYVFVKPGGGWAGSLTQTAKLTASDGAAGDQFGWSVAVSGDTVLVGAQLNDDNSTSSGSAYVFVKPGGGWAGSLTQTAKLTASDGAAGDQFGYSVAVSGDTVVVGALFDDDNGRDSGSAYVFVEPGGGWAGSLTQTAKLTASDGAAGDQFGESVAVSGDTVVVGALFDDDNGTSSGSAYVFVKPGGGWAGSLTQTAKLTASDAAANDLFGRAVVVSGDTVVVSALFDDDNGFNSGSAYVFGPAGPVEVTIDIKPGSDPNSINVKSKGVIPVAIISTTDFDASSVMASSSALEGALADHGGHLEDVSGDGLFDLVLHFRTQETDIACGDTSAILTGTTGDGQEITGEDSVRTVPCKK